MKEWVLIHVSGTYYGKKGEWTADHRDAMILEAAQAATLQRRYLGVATVQKLERGYEKENLTQRKDFSSSLVAA